MSVKFGPGGNCRLFYEEGNKSSLQIPQWLSGKGLSAYEYECGKGIKISYDSAKILRENAEKYGISISVHAPYFISLSSTEEEKREKSVKYILDSLALADTLGACRIVVHSGSCGKITRKTALGFAADTLKKALEEADRQGFEKISICPETMGKVKQLGTIEEVCTLCKIDERLIPTVDFGHINSMSLGGLKKYEDYLRIFDVVRNKLGSDREKNLHIHYSRIEFTNAGEKKHHCYRETEYGPEFEPVAEIIAKRNLSPTIICESGGTQTEDAVALMNMYFEKRRENG